MPKLSRRPPQAGLRLELECDFGRVRGIAQTVSQLLAEHHWGESEVLDCELALVEACNNAIKYATPRARSKPVIVEARCDRQHLELRITDHTRGFTWPRRVALPDPESPSGRGLYLIHAVMDEIHYIQQSDGNTLVLGKRRRA